MNMVFGYIVPFLAVFTVLVFVHELGHYWVARRVGVRVETFSIGFGREIWGRTDRFGTRWRLSAVPLGGYVKFAGDADAASRPDPNSAAAQDPMALQNRPLGQRAAVVAAGPLANFAFAIVVLAGLFATVGQPFTPAVVGAVEPESAAAAAGILPGDRFVELDGRRIERFEDVQQIIRLKPETALAAAIERDGAVRELTLTPRAIEETDRFGNRHRLGRLGISRAAAEYRRYDPFTAVWRATLEVRDIVSGTLVAVGQMISGTRSTDELGGPLRIAQMSGDAARSGLLSVVWFAAVLSINLGLLNLFPIPVLDGGHLLFYGIEGIRGRPLGDKAREWGFRIGFMLVMALFVFAMWNDFTQPRVLDFFRGLLT